MLYTNSDNVNTTFVSQCITLACYFVVMIVMCIYKSCNWPVSVNEVVAVRRDNCFFTL